MGFRRAARTDANQTEIVEGLRKAGCSVLITSQLKNAFDILVGARGFNFAFEIKDGNKPPSGRRLTPGERNFRIRWRGHYDVIHSVSEALEIIEKKVG